MNTNLYKIHKIYKIHKNLKIHLKKGHETFILSKMMNICFQGYRFTNFNLNNFNLQYLSLHAVITLSNTLVSSWLD